MPTGLCLHIGLNRVDPAVYNGWRGELEGCVADATEMLKLANAGGFKPVVGNGLLLDDQATSTNIFDAIKQAATQLSDGDVFLLTYAGHGLQDDGKEPDRMNEEWVLFDRIVIDDHISAALHEFANGVRVVVVADTCHAAGVIDDQFFSAVNHGTRRFRIMPSDVKAKTIAAHPEFVEPGSAAGAAKKPPRASILLVAACGDKELAQDNNPNGVFTAVLVNTIKNSPPTGYGPLVKTIGNITKTFGQNPELRPFGPPAGRILADPVFTVPK